jgi:hypothetical protein
MSEKQKNPKRQFGQYLAMIKTQRKMMVWAGMFIVAAAAFSVLSFSLDWHWAWKVLGVVSTFTTTIQLGNESARLKAYQAKVNELEANAVDI